MSCPHCLKPQPSQVDSSFGACYLIPDWPWVVVEVECSLCHRRGRYRLARLAERFGAAAYLAPLLNELASTCGLPKFFEKTRQYEARCGARFRVPTGGPLPDGVPAREVGPKEGAPRRPQRRGPEGPALTVGDALASGPRGVRVSCLATRSDGWRCHHQGLVDLVSLGLPAGLPYAHIPGRRVLRCSRCGSRDVGVMPDWPSPQEAQSRRMSDGAPPVRVLNGVAMSIGGGEAEAGDPTAPGPTA